MKNLSLLQHLHLQIDLCAGICITGDTLFKITRIHASGAIQVLLDLLLDFNLLKTGAVK